MLAAACGGAESKRRRRRRRRTLSPGDGGATGRVYVDRISPYSRQRLRSRLELHGDTLFQGTREGIVVWDTLAMKPIATHAFEYQSFCLLWDGSLAAYAVPAGSDHFIVYRLGRNQKLAFPGPRAFTEPGHIFPANGADGHDYYLLRKSTLLALDVEHGRVEIDDIIDLPRGYAIPALVYPLGDGRLVIGGSQIHVLDNGKLIRTRELARTPAHIVRMPDERFWYSVEDRDERIDTLELTQVMSSAPIERRVAFAHEHVVHIASAPTGDLAVLLFWMDRSEGKFEDAVRWTVLVLDAHGRERWRSEVPRSHAAGTWIELNTKAFVAISERRVVLQGLRNTLLFWDAANGTLLGTR